MSVPETVAAGRQAFEPPVRVGALLQRASRLRREALHDMKSFRLTQSFNGRSGPRRGLSESATRCAIVLVVFVGAGGLLGRQAQAQAPAAPTGLPPAARAPATPPPAVPSVKGKTIEPSPPASATAPPRKPSLGCIIGEFRTIALTQNDPQQRYLAAMDWLEHKGPACPEDKLLVLRENRAMWLGTADRPQVRDRIDFLLESTADGSGAGAASLYAAKPPPPPQVVESSTVGVRPPPTDPRLLPPPPGAPYPPMPPGAAYPAMPPGAPYPTMPPGAMVAQPPPGYPMPGMAPGYGATPGMLATGLPNAGIPMGGAVIAPTIVVSPGNQPSASPPQIGGSPSNTGGGGAPSRGR